MKIISIEVDEEIAEEFELQLVEFIDNFWGEEKNRIRIEKG